MSHHEPTANKHPKHDFQVERLAFFSDAVFAIAITLLVIEFKIPHVDEKTTYAEVWNELAGMKYKFLSLLFSFLLISNYWVRHHLLFKHIHNYNRSILTWNLMMLLPVIFFPFSTAFFYASIENSNVIILACRIFLLNNIAAGVMTYILYWMVTKKYPEMTYPMEEEERDVFAYRVVWMTVSFVCIFMLTYISTIEVSAIGVLPMFFARLYKKFFKKKTHKIKHAK